MEVGEVKEPVCCGWAWGKSTIQITSPPLGCERFAPKAKKAALRSNKSRVYWGCKKAHILLASNTSNIDGNLNCSSSRRAMAGSSSTTCSVVECYGSRISKSHTVVSSSEVPPTSSKSQLQLLCHSRLDFQEQVDASTG